MTALTVLVVVLASVFGVIVALGAAVERWLDDE